MRNIPVQARAFECPTKKKRGYDTRKAARYMLKRLRGDGAVTETDEKRLSVYKCSCGLFHIGSEYRGARRHWNI